MKKICVFLLSVLLLLTGCAPMWDSSYHTGRHEDFGKEENEMSEGNGAQTGTTGTEALEFVANMGVGWNLGNTMDAYDNGFGFNSELSYETMWSGAVTTQELVDAVKAAGFNILRIPISWNNHLSKGDRKINEEWINRVREIVDYAYNQDMYVIINTHHDLHIAYYYPSKEYEERSIAFVETVWSQIAEYFKDYGDRLIFEGINEPRLKDTKYEWNFDSNATECVEAMEVINKMNQAFVDTVRSAGGNNETRYLMVPGYAASLHGCTNEYFVLPADAQNRVIVSIHAYVPYNFALQAETESGSVKKFNTANISSTRDIDWMMESIQETFLSKGVPVIIGEFGARDKDNEEDRAAYVKYYLEAAKEIGVSCLLWDNHNFSDSGEAFGLIDRETYKWKFPLIMDAISEVTGQ